MKQPKPIATIKTKCKECQEEDGSPHIHTSACQGMYEGCQECCKGTGEQEIKLYSLKDFEKCNGCSGTGIQLGKGGSTPNSLILVEQECEDCKDGIGYKIPFKNYEIKKISDIPIEDMDKNEIWEAMVEHNLKEDDKIVLRKV